MRSEAAARSVVDLARGMLMEQLGCSPAEAQAQLTHLSAESGSSVAELAAQITGQPGARGPSGPGEPDGLDRPKPRCPAAPGRPGRGRRGDGARRRRHRRGLLEEALAPAGAVAVALWLTEPDGGLELVGQAGFSAREASRWRRIHPDMRHAARRRPRTTAPRSGGRPGRPDGRRWPR